MLNQPDYNKEKPKTLYRGIIINYQLLQDYQFYGVDLVPPNPPLIDDKGRKTVGDGNEYGVYMTDHDVVARKAYAAVEVNDGIPIKKDVFFGYDRSRTVIPSIGIVYKINTEGIDVHIPWITSHLQGHYNNGMGGDEWIAESISANNYSIDTIQIGPDTLHDSEFIKIPDITTVKQELLHIINQRKERLELFENKIESMSANERLLMDESKIQILKSIYKLNGIMDIDINNYNPQDPKEYMDYLMAVVYSKNKENIDYNTLTYIKSLKDRVKKETTIDEIVEKINKEIKRNEDKKSEFIEKKKLSGEEYSTTSFDKKIEMYKGFLKELENKTNSKSQLGYSREESETSITEKQQQVLKDYSGEKIGHRIITSTYDMEKGIEIIDTVGEIENEDETYKISDKQQVYGGELQVRRKEVTRFNKLTGQNEQYVYQKDKNENEIYYKIVEGKLSEKITRNARGTTLNEYSDGQIMDSFEYDKNGEALLGREGLDNIDENYIEKYFDVAIPYFEAENSDLQIQQSSVDTQKLGKETLDMQQDTETLDSVQKQMEEHEYEINQFGEIVRKEGTANRFDLSGATNEYVNQTLNEFVHNLENENLDEENKKKKDDEFKVEKGDDYYIR